MSTSGVKMKEKKEERTQGETTEEVSICHAAQTSELLAHKVEIHSSENLLGKFTRQQFSTEKIPCQISM